MSVLSRCVMEITETDYNGDPVTYQRIRPKFDGVIDWFHTSYPIWYDVEIAKTEIKAEMTTAGVTWDSEI